jgi:mRNA interferase MazF
MIFDAGDVVVVPFPFSDLPVARPRPALVLSLAGANARAGTTVLAMITTAANSRRPDDVELADLNTAGLRAPSVVRMKLFSLDNRLLARRVGVIGTSDRTAVRAGVQALIAI